MNEHYIFDPAYQHCEICDRWDGELNEPCPGLTPEQELEKTAYLAAQAKAKPRPRKRAKPNERTDV